MAARRTSLKGSPGQKSTSPGSSPTTSSPSAAGTRRHPNARVGNGNAIVHGGTSDDRIRPVAANHRRRVLRQIGLRASDLNPLGRGYLDLYCRSIAKVEILDAYFAEHGLLKADGEPQAGAKLYIAAVNSARHALAKLEAHLRDRKRDPVIELNAYLASLDDGEQDDAPSA